MIDFRSVYRESEEKISIYIIGLFLLLGLLILAQSYFSALIISSVVIAILFLLLTFFRPLLTIGFLAVYLPFEPFLLKFIPDDLYVFSRYFSEGLIYILAFSVLYRWLIGKIKFNKSPIDLPFGLFLLVLLAGIVIHLVPIPVALLGARQIIRFMLIFFIVFYLKPSKVFIQKLTFILFGVVLFQSALGLLQPIFGQPLDNFLLPSEEKYFADVTLTQGVNQFWEAGSRIFATLGRYDLLGNFLYLFLLLGVGYLYEIPKKNPLFFWFFLFGISALILTASRSSWFAFLLGLFFIAVIVRRHKTVLVSFLAFILLAMGYLGLSGLNVRFITEAPGQSLIERFYETFSYARFKGEYYGIGRVFWFIQTPLKVIPASPFFGFGPGQFGGGAVASLHNTTVYDQLGLPFGIFGTGGVIDNNWFSLWGETGTLGIIFYAWIFVILFLISLKTYKISSDPFTRAICLGFAAILIGITFNAFLSTVFEIRTVAFYLWMYGGFIAVIASKNKDKTTE